MDIEQLVTLVTKQVRERLEGFEKRKRVLLLGSSDGCDGGELHEMFESSGFSLCYMENYKGEQDLEEYEYVLIPKARFNEMLQKVKVDKCCSLTGEEVQEAAGQVCLIDKRIISEQDIQKLVREGCREIRTGKRTVVTPLALDTAKVWGIRIVKE